MKEYGNFLRKSIQNKNGFIIIVKVNQQLNENKSERIQIWDY